MPHLDTRLLCMYDTTATRNVLDPVAKSVCVYVCVYVYMCVYMCMCVYLSTSIERNCSRSMPRKNRGTWSDWMKPATAATLSPAPT